MLQLFKTRIAMRLALFALLFNVAGKAHGQITSLLTGVGVSPTPCVVPALYPFELYVISTGASGPTDSFTVYTNFGDGTDTTFKMQIGFWWSGGSGGPTDTSVGYIDHWYNLAGTYQPFITITAPSGISDTPYIEPFTLANTCANITGQLYVDADGDCMMDAGETLLNNAYILATNSTTGQTYYSTATGSGSYAIHLPVGETYTLSQSGYWWSGMAPTCPTGGTATVTVSGTGGFTQDFGFNCSSTDPDLSVAAWANNFRPGFDRPLGIVGLSNNFCTSMPATAMLTLPAPLSYSNTSSGPAPTVSGNTLTWNVASLDALNSLFSWMQIYCDPTATIGDSACLTLTISTASAETNTANNTYNFCVPINNSYDPNDKSVSPRGMGSEGYIDAQTEGLTYLVNFQNTGNDVAYNVTIADQLDADIDPASIYVVGASHAYTSTIADGNLLKFRFNNIMLPDSNANEPQSHGWVMYRARIKDASHQPGTVINNTANIYFDYNEAIITNTTTNTLMTPTGVQVISQGKLEATVAPNPADGALTVSVKDGKAATATLVDMTGRLVAQQENAAGRMELATKALPAGMYLLQVRSGNAVLNTKVSVKH